MPFPNKNKKIRQDKAASRLENPNAAAAPAWKVSPS
jgi:hypothetical protein